jgi:hypothetical protein
LGASTNRIFFDLFFDAVKTDGLPNVLVPGLAVVTLVDDLAHCEPVTNAVDAFEDIHPNILVVRSVVSELLVGEASDVVFCDHARILLQGSTKHKFFLCVCAFFLPPRLK